jgi:hypothetical protein
MKTHPLDRLLRSAASARRSEAVAPTASLDPVFEQRVLASVRRARSDADSLGLLAVLRWGLAFAGCAALCAILVSVGTPSGNSLDEAFAVPEPETYLALQ